MNDPVKRLVKARDKHRSPVNLMRYRKYTGGGRPFRKVFVEELKEMGIFGYNAKGSVFVTRVSNTELGVFRRWHLQDLQENRAVRNQRYNTDLNEYEDYYGALKPLLIIGPDTIRSSSYEGEFDPMQFKRHNHNEILLRLFNNKQVLKSGNRFEIRQQRQEFYWKPEMLESEKGTVASVQQRYSEANAEYIIKCPLFYVYRTDMPGQTRAVVSRVPMYKNIEFDFNGIPCNTNTEQAKASQKAFDLYMEHYRARSKRMRAASKADKDATMAIHKARSENDFSNLKASDVFKVRNVSERRLYLQHYKVEQIIEEMNDVEIVDKEVINNGEYQLIKFPHPDPDNRFPHCYYLKMINPSTDETHLEGVGPYGDVNGIADETVQAALKWRDGDGAVNLVNGQINSNNPEFRNGEFDYEIPVAIT